MKSTMFVLAITVCACVIGCQENTINGPDNTARPSFGQPTGPSFARNVPANRIHLNTQLMEPGPFFNSITKVNGYIDYTTTVLPRDPVPPFPQYSISVGLSVHAELRPFGYENPVWYVSGSSSDVVLTINDGAASIEKTYRVMGRNDEVSLKVRFRISTTSVEVERLWLELPRNAAVANAN